MNKIYAVLLLSVLVVGCGSSADPGAAGAAGPSGSSGLPGPTGPTGPAGVDGVEGPAGPKGAQGPAGPQGEAGPAGAAGPQGVAGPQGEAGPAGPQGIQGPAGPAGATGSQGPAGPTGATGAAGPVGPTGSITPANIYTRSSAWTPLLRQQGTAVYSQCDAGDVLLSGLCQGGGISSTNHLVNIGPVNSASGYTWECSWVNSDTTAVPIQQGQAVAYCLNVP